MGILDSENRTATSPAPRARMMALAGISLAMLLSSLGTSIANVGLPAMAEAFGAPFAQIQWVVIAYLLTITACIVGAGRLGDMIGRRRLLVAGILLFTAASAGCGLANSLPLLIAARAVQGVGAAIMMALSMALVGDTVPKERTGSAIGLLGTMSATGTALGPSLGGVLIATAGWPWIFVINVPLGLLAAVLAYRQLPVDPATRKGVLRSFDLRGLFLLALMLVCYGAAFTSRMFGTWNAVLLGAALLLMAAFIDVEKRAASPLIATSLFQNRLLRARLAANALVSTVMMATLVVGPFYLARGLGLGAALVGLTMSAGPLVAALAGVPAGRVVDRHGVDRMALVGLAGLAAGCAALAVLPASGGVAAYVIPLMLITASYALFQAANNTAVMNAVPGDERGLASGLVNLSRNLGLITGASALGAIFAFGTGSGDIATASPVAVAAGMRLAFTAAAVLGVIAFSIAVAGGRPKLAAPA
jgi:EmrB/QacA subfamily drug resistance transporter